MEAAVEHCTFDAGCSLHIACCSGLPQMPHRHPVPELIACRSGSASVTLDGQLYTLLPGQCLLCPAESIHCIGSGFQLLVMQFSPEMLNRMRLTEPVFQDRYGLIRQLEAIHGEYQGRAPFWQEKVNALLVCVLADILRHEAFCEEERRSVRSLRQYRALLAYIGERLPEMTFSDAAAYLGMSDAYFSRFFHQMSGMTFSRYLNTVRVERAIDILNREPHTTMTEIIGRCGFNTLRNFNRVFREITGAAPTQLPSRISRPAGEP